MDNEINSFKNTEEFALWLKENKTMYELSLADAEILMGYMEGHDYILGHDGECNLFRLDVNKQGAGWDRYTLDDIIDICCEWNYELILEEEENDRDSLAGNTRYEKYKQDEAALDRMYDKTSYGLQIENLARQIAGEMLAKLTETDDIEKSALVVGERIRDIINDKRGGR